MKWRMLIGKTALFLAAACLFTPPADAHLCDDVFRQAKDNLAVKVDVRDGQLRVGREASFRVHVLNTMDRDIVEIMLRVRSDEFEADVRPSPEWRNYPYLRTAARGGRRQYFEVTLRRKPGVPDGTYRIELDLYSERMNMSFLRLGLDEAIDTLSLPAAGRIEIDGRASREEWGEAPLCYDFTAYRREGRYFQNVPPRWPVRARVLQDPGHLFFLFSLQSPAALAEDRITILASKSGEEEPVRLVLDRLGGEAATVRRVPAGNGERRPGYREETAPAEGVSWTASEDGATVEARVPRSLLGLEGADSFLLNFSRAASDGEHREVSYWRGNDHSWLDPMTHARFVAPRND